MNKKRNTKWIIEQSKLLFGDSFDYSATEYRDAKTKIKFRCKKHDYSFEQISIDRSVLDGQEILLKPNEEVTIAMHENNPIDIILPTTVTLQVTKSEPAVKGDSVNSSTKEVTCETGFTLQVPMFIEENEFIKIDTKTYTYITRA